MATYTTVGPEGKIIAKLKMGNWLKPTLWDDEGPIPDHWPAAEIDSLCNLFTGAVPSDRGEEGLFIDETLGRHIAVIMAQWSNQKITFQSKNTRHADDFSPTSARDIATDQINRARAISQIIGQWYATGVAIYSALTPQPATPE